MLRLKINFQKIWWWINSHWKECQSDLWSLIYNFKIFDVITLFRILQINKRTSVIHFRNVEQWHQCMKQTHIQNGDLSQMSNFTQNFSFFVIFSMCVYQEYWDNKECLLLLLFSYDKLSNWLKRNETFFECISCVFMINEC